jgi:two-component system chemotaxis response regulator CheB
MSTNDNLSYAQRIRVLIVDDSAVMRRIIMSTLLKHDEIEVVGTSANGLEAIADIKRIKPDLVTMDIEMPKMDGLTALKQIRSFDQYLPIIMFSSLTLRGAEATLDALTFGASDYVAKPTNLTDSEEAFRVLNEQLVPKIKQLGCKKRFVRSLARAQIVTPQSLSPLAALSPSKEVSSVRAGRIRVPLEALCIGVSTGGPAALTQLFSDWKVALSVPILIVQHMPPKFPELLAIRLSTLGAVPAVEAVNGQEIEAGHAYLAPGGRHMELYRSASGKVIIRLNDNAPECSCRPAVDVLFRSAANVYGNRLLAMVLTGMGNDGLKGSAQVVQEGGRVLVQDEASSVIWGMPGAVVNANLADKVLPLSEMAQEVVARLPKK